MPVLPNLELFASQRDGARVGKGGLAASVGCTQLGECGLRFVTASARRCELLARRLRFGALTYRARAREQD